MSYQATAVNVMVASPGDVLKYRIRAREIVTEWNFIHSKFTKIVLLPIGWDTHVPPDLNGPAQKIINESILVESDILVGIFWTRIGTATAEAVSGSAEEIEKHLKSGRPAMIYFSREPVAPDTIDQEQYKALKEFKSWCKGEGIIREFDAINDFSDQLRNDLALKVNEAVSSGVISSPGNSGVVKETALAGPFALTKSIPELSPEASILLKTTASSHSGTLMKLSFIGGRHLQAGGKQFGSEDQRSFAKWEHALGELLALGLITERGYKGEVFEVTTMGYNVADKIEDE